MGFRDEALRKQRFFYCSKFGEFEMGITVNEAGKMGGLSLLQTKGREHFSVIGKKGQETLRKRYPGMASEWGKKGGRPRKNNL
jgi:hypothetical protein